METQIASDLSAAYPFLPRPVAPAPRAFEILIVGHDSQLRAETAEFLSRQGYKPWVAGDADAARGILARGEVDLMILGDLSNMSGLDLCRDLMLVQSAPTIVLSEEASELDRILALELGADDLLPRRCNQRELLARTRALLRRSPGNPVSGSRKGWALNERKRLLATPEGNAISLTTLECALLTVLSEEPTKMIAPESAAHLFCGGTARNPGSALRTAITRLRRKIGDEGSHMIRTVTGRGYCLDVALHVS